MNKKNNKLKNLFLWVLLFLTWTIFIFSFGITVTKSIFNLSAQNQKDKKETISISCLEIKNTVKSKRKVILRLDDVQAFAFSNTTRKIIDESLSRNIPLVLGIIPNHLDEDVDLVEYLKSRSCNAEIALHGWDHSVKYINEKPESEFEHINYDEAKSRLETGISMIQNTLKSSTKSFIPPENKISKEGKQALNDLNITVISADSGNEFDMTIATIDQKNNLIPIKNIISACEKKFAKNTNCVIVIHPQDYLTYLVLDPVKFKSFTDLLTEIQRKGWEVTTFSGTK